MLDNAIRFVSLAAAITVVAVSAGTLFKATRAVSPASTVTQLVPVVITAHRS